MRDKTIFNLAKKVFVVAIIICSLYGSNLKDHQEIYILPYDNTKALDRLMELIKDSKSTIDIAIYNFTNKKIQKALEHASTKGVKIRIIYDHDKDQENYDKSTFNKMSTMKNIQACKMKDQGKMHQKMIIIDNKIIGLGSANWNNKSFNKNYEVLLFTDHNKNIEYTKKHYESMFNRCMQIIK